MQGNVGGVRGDAVFAAVTASDVWHGGSKLGDGELGSSKAASLEISFGDDIANFGVQDELPAERPVETMVVRAIICARHFFYISPGVLVGQHKSMTEVLTMSLRTFFFDEGRY